MKQLIKKIIEEISILTLEDKIEAINEVKKELVANCDKNGYGSSDHIKVKDKGYSLFYTENTNFMGGANNGGGKGFFARLYFVGLCKDIKLA